MRLADLFTDREAQVAALVCEGLTNIQIGRRLGISPNTVREHLWQMGKKLPGDANGVPARRRILVLGRDPEPPRADPLRPR